MDGDGRGLVIDEKKKVEERGEEERERKEHKTQTRVDSMFMRDLCSSLDCLCVRGRALKRPILGPAGSGSVMGMRVLRHTFTSRSALQHHETTRFLGLSLLS